MEDVNNPEFWNDRYITNETGWDMGGPTPVFQTIASRYPKGKVCIIGSGRGYDAVEFSLHGFDVTAVDFAPRALEDLRDMAAQQNTIVETVESDLFNLPAEFNGTFDYVVEYTCFCAIDPDRRREYEHVVYSCLKKHGQLIGLWFPMDKTMDMGGPPWGTTEDEVCKLFSKRWKINQNKVPENSISPRKGREKLIIFEKL